MQKKVVKIFLIVIIGTFSNVFSQSTKSDWSSFQFLIGEWQGEGSGKPEEFSKYLDGVLKKKI